MNRRQALRELADDLLGKLRELQEHDQRYGHALAQLGTKDHDRWMLAHEELAYRLGRIADPGIRRKKQQVSAPDPDQVALFE